MAPLRRDDPETKLSRGRIALPTDKAQLIREVAETFARLGLDAAPPHVADVAEYHGRWLVEMAALRARLEQRDAVRDRIGPDDLS